MCSPYCCTAVTCDIRYQWIWGVSSCGFVGIFLLLVERLKCAHIMSQAKSVHNCIMTLASSSRSECGQRFLIWRWNMTSKIPPWRRFLFFCLLMILLSLTTIPASAYVLAQVTLLQFDTFLSCFWIVTECASRWRSHSPLDKHCLIWLWMQGCWLHCLGALLQLPLLNWVNCFDCCLGSAFTIVLIVAWLAVFRSILIPPAAYFLAKLRFAAVCITCLLIQSSEFNYRGGSTVEIRESRAGFR